MTADPNPYSPPASGTLEAEEKDFPWYVAAKGIYVREGAVLPRVDLKSGSTGMDLLPLSYQVRASASRWRPVYPIVLIIGLSQPR